MTKTGGFDDFADDLNDLADQFDDMADEAEELEGELEGENEVPFNELFTEKFMRQNTDVDSFDEFLEQSQWEVESQEDFRAIPDDEFDEYVDEHSDFDSWEEMLGTAGREKVARDLGFQD